MEEVNTTEDETVSASIVDVDVIVAEEDPVPDLVPDDVIPLDSFIDLSSDEPPIRLKSRNDVYYKLYKETRQRAREAKREALANYLEANRIKTTYLLEDVSDSDSDLEESMAM